MAQRKIYVVKPETRRRCEIVPATEEAIRMFKEVSFELFHFFYQIDTIPFSIYFRVGDEIIEFIRPEEHCAELLDQISQAVTKEYENISILMRFADMEAYAALMNSVRKQKIDNLLKKDPALDPKILDMFADLSSASQMVVRGGITQEVDKKVKATAAQMVDTLMQSEVAIGTLTKMVLADPTLYDHSASVAMIAGVIATKLLPQKKLQREDAETVARSGLYHDVGKTCIPAAVLNKPGKFTPEEFEVMKTHTVLGYEELNKARTLGAPIDELVARVALEHHERFTGKGYPFGRKGRFEEHPNGIHLYTRIVTVADVYSALLMERVYKPAYDAKDALAIMIKQAADEYDPDIFAPFLKHVIKSLDIQLDRDPNAPSAAAAAGRPAGKIIQTKGKDKPDKGKILIIEDKKITVKKPS
ncbi:MAG: HD-GYP domain-containing protein [Oligoflexales bacterium]